ncbi:mitochondrial carrier domain-containing protein [Flagelloscypha sp. PMI_526]|nr:mitochondrial carrier domain-containing protein [Flagelloscypha sp. PMI_526]
MSTDVSRRRTTQNWEHVVLSGIAGGIAGCAAKTVVAPLDRVKILFQTSNPEYLKYTGTWKGAWQAGKEIFATGGFRSLMQGHSATLARVFPYAGIKFMAYEEAVSLFCCWSYVRNHLGSVTYPLEVIRVRMAFDTHTSPNSSQRPTFIGTFRTMWHEHATHPSSSSSHPPSFAAFPLLKFYRGFSATLVGMVPYAGTSFLIWNVLHSHLLPPSNDGKTKSAPLTNLVVGGISGMVSQTASYPFEVVRRRMQVGGITRPDRWLRWGETFGTIWKDNGFRGFYVGLSIGYLKVVPMTAVSYAVWQSLKAAFGI